MIDLITAPTQEPISMDELVIFMKIDDESMVENHLLESSIKDGREYIETITRRAILTQTWDYYINSFPGADSFKLPFGNLQSVTHVKYTNSDGTTTTMTVNTDYLVETNTDQCGRIVLPYDTDWPNFTAYPSKPIVVRFVCGWTSRALVPERIKTGIKLAATDFYENREAQTFSTGFQSFQDNKMFKKKLIDLKLWDEFL